MFLSQTNSLSASALVRIIFNGLGSDEFVQSVVKLLNSQMLDPGLNSCCSQGLFVCSAVSHLKTLRAIDEYLILKTFNIQVDLMSKLSFIGTLTGVHS